MNRKKIRSLGLAIVLAMTSVVTVGAHGGTAVAASGNLLSNPGLESGTTGWTAFGAGTVASNTSVVHGGAQSLLRAGRTASWNGPAQSVTSVLTNNSSYTTSVWMRT